MSIAQHHAEWLSLVEVSGPFLAMKVLARIFPQGLPDHPSELRQRLQIAHEEWLDNQEGLRPDPALHTAWIRFVLREALGYEDQDLVQGQGLPASLTVTVPEHHESLRPTYAVLEPKGREHAGAARLLIDVLPITQNLDHALAGRAWKASPATRMMTLLHGAAGAAPGEAQIGPRLGLITNGREWKLVHAAPGETTTYASFPSYLFFDEPITLRAFQGLLSLRRLFGVADSDTLTALFAESSQYQQEVTDQLGLQVRHAVEVLVQGIDGADRDSKRKLLQGVTEEQLYQAAVTVMMRLVFLFAAEEKDLLLLGNQIYDDNYAVSTLHGQLQEIADKQGEEVLERRYAAWCRLMATFRALFGGVWHEDIPLPAYGGSLFDPDRFPFLEGRPLGTKWKAAGTRETAPLAINDKTVLHLLRSLRLLEMRVGGGRTEARRLSFRSLGVEQIGHVYEGLLDHTAKRAKGLVVSLSGKNEPELDVGLLEAKKVEGPKALVEWLAEETGHSEKAVEKALEYRIPKEEERRLMVACDNVPQKYGRVAPWAGLVRKDSSGNPLLIHEGGIYVTDGAERRSTGTHYTPRSLTEPVVQHTLEPLVYEGPAEGWLRAEWKLKSPKAILALRVCDFTMGSGAFLVQACRFLSVRLVESWEAAERASGGRLLITPEGDLANGNIGERILATDVEERIALARRFVADRCLYGVDKNPMAVEMAKLSLWLVTLQKDRPFTFIDHALRCGDSLLGVTDLAQLERFHLDPKRAGTLPLGIGVIRPAIRRAVDLRRAIERRATETQEDATAKAHLLGQACDATDELRLVGDLIVGAALMTATRNASALDDKLVELAEPVRSLLGEEDTTASRMKTRSDLRARADALLNDGRGTIDRERRPFHWTLEFPEVFAEEPRGFDAIVGNPPFLGGSLISNVLGEDYRPYLAALLTPGLPGRVDLSAYFLIRTSTLTNTNGLVGLLTTDSAFEGDSERVAIRSFLADGVKIVRAATKIRWPGTANVFVHATWSTRRPWLAPSELDGVRVAEIDSLLRAKAQSVGHPHEIEANLGLAWRGTEARGEGFTLSTDDVARLSREDPKSVDIIRPYLDGVGLNSSPTGAALRWIIDFGEMSESEARGYGACFQHVESLVKPYRATIEGPLHEDAFWRFWDKRLERYRQLAQLGRALAIAKVSPTNAVAWVRPGTVFHEKVIIFLLADDAAFSLLQSSLHWEWVREYTSSRGATTLNYSPSHCFWTLPFPVFSEAMRLAGHRYHAVRTEIAVSRGEGLTSLCRCLHEPENNHGDIVKLRDLQVEMDQAVVAAYQWTDFPLEHGFHETKQGKRFTISEPARREILDRLLALNHQRYAEEVAAGLHDKDKKKTKAPKHAPAPAPDARPAPQLGLFDSRPAPAPAKGPAASTDAEAILVALRSAYAPLGKTEILAASGVAESGWKAALDQLKASGQIEQVGERRGAKYQLARTQAPKVDPIVQRPEVDPASDARLVICSLVQTRGGRATWADVMGAFTLLFQPDMLVRHAPHDMKASAKQWALQVGGRLLAPGLLGEATTQLARDERLRSAAVGMSKERELLATGTMPALSTLPPWHREEAQLAFTVLAAMTEASVRDVMNELAEADRRAVG